MAIAFGTVGNSANGTTSVAVPYPATPAAEDIFVLCVSSKYPANPPTTPDGWTLVGRESGGSGASGADSGQATVSVFTKEADGTETGNLTVSVPSGNVAIGRMARYTKDAAKVWSVATVKAQRNTGGSPWSVTGDALLDLAPGDMLLVVSGTNTDAYSHTTHTIAAAGVTVWGTATERMDSTTLTGDDTTIVMVERSVTTGTATDPPTYSMTPIGSTADAPAGATVFVRLREIDAPASGHKNLLLLGVG